MITKYKKGYCKGHKIPCRKEQPTYIFAKERCLDCYRAFSQAKYQRKRKPTGERALFNEIWNESNKTSYLSGRRLSLFEGSKMYVNCFAHLLPKGKYPELRLNKNNIILLHPEEHFLLDQGTKQQRENYAKQHNCTWDKIYKKQNELRTKNLEK